MDGHDTLKAARAPGAQVRAWLLDRLATDCGYTLGPVRLGPLEAP